MFGLFLFLLFKALYVIGRPEPYSLDLYSTPVPDRNNYNHNRKRVLRDLLFWQCDRLHFQDNPSHPKHLEMLDKKEKVSF